MRLLLLPSLVQPQSGSTWTKKRFATETCMYIHTHTHIYIHVYAHTRTPLFLSSERWREIVGQLCKCCGRKKREREREGGRQKAKGRERSGKSAKEEEQRQRFSSLKKVSFGLAFCHPLLTSVQPFSGKFSNVCHPLRPFLLHGQCLSDRSPRQSHGNRDGFTVAGNPCRIYRLHSSGYVFLYLPFRISSASPLSANCNRVVRFHGQRRVLLPSRLCSLRVTKTFFSFFSFFFFFPEEFSKRGGKLSHLAR